MRRIWPRSLINWRAVHHPHPAITNHCHTRFINRNPGATYPNQIINHPRGGTRRVSSAQALHQTLLRPRNHPITNQRHQNFVLIANEDIIKLNAAGYYTQNSVHQRKRRILHLMMRPLMGIINRSLLQAQLVLSI